ncbi:GNAT family N-acetyltransferase [Paenibacillus urinalis]|uniref:GNAT family N-acetyltransferase n=1 Tax=Paenibacillus urinalis TaxID=521520 RepID=A0ABY7X462_9BACL|nr:GNAT family N-acetyltransferase [Paenibacillus urinalis]WDH96991.1 GNAT family N-acetyltransferase [Paenibacillus urinalis]WDI00638.1 GNAT family N-acetyltransferase [Paenibacillus urinalis]
MAEFVRTPPIQEIATFIARMNSSKSSNVGYAGMNRHEIEASLTEEFSDLSLEDSIVVYMEEGKIVGILGFDVELEAGAAEIWGPFIDTEFGPLWQRIATDLWNTGLAKLESRVHTFKGFYNTANDRGRELMNQLKADYKQKETVLVIKPDALIKEQGGAYFHHASNGSIEAWDERWAAPFSTLHDQCFPSTYYNSTAILERRSNENRLFLYTQEEELLGYVYTEGNEEHAEGSLEYIAVAAAARNKGIGTALMRYAVTDLFERAIEEVKLCVSSSNHTALGVYLRAGFTVEQELEFYILNTEECTSAIKRRKQNEIKYDGPSNC